MVLHPLGVTLTRTKGRALGLAPSLALAPSLYSISKKVSDLRKPVSPNPPDVMVAGVLSSGTEYDFLPSEREMSREGTSGELESLGTISIASEASSGRSVSVGVADNCSLCCW